MHFFGLLRCIFSYNKQDNLNFFKNVYHLRLNFHLALVCQKCKNGYFNALYFQNLGGFHEKKT